MSQTTTSNMNFMTLATLKAKLGATSISIVKSPKTNKLFGNTDNGINLKVQQDLDPKKEIRYMYTSKETFNEGCIVNVTPANPPVFTL